MVVVQTCRDLQVVRLAINTDSASGVESRLQTWKTCLTRYFGSRLQRASGYRNTLWYGR